MKHTAVTLVLLGMLSACTVGPDYQGPPLDAPQRWSEAAPPVGTAAKAPEAWWKTFNDALLHRLIADAELLNLDLQQTAARIADARAQRDAVNASALPSVSARSTINRRLNNISSAALGPDGGNTTTASGGFGTGDQIVNIMQSGFDAQWEVDIFGSIRRAEEAAAANLEAEQENRRDALVSLRAEVARNYIELRVNQRLLAIARMNLLDEQEVAELVQVRQHSGLASTLEVAEAQTQTAATEAQLPVYAAAVHQAMHALSVLLGREPGALAALLQRAAEIPAAPAAVAADLPSELLRRRPDIRRAERQLAAANAQIGVATAELYPKVNLAAFIGLQNLTITDFTPQGKSWSLASSLSMPLFNWGKLQANIASKKAQHQEALLAYQSTVLIAFREVEDGLSTYAQELQRRRALLKAVAAAQLAVDLAKERYRKGLTGFLDVLVTQRALLRAQSDLADSEAKVSANLVALYKALGGGWQVTAVEPEKR